MRRRLKILAWAGVVLSLLWAVVYFFWSVTAYTSDASIRADWVEISPRVNGWIDAVHVTTDQRVKSGQKLMTIHQLPYQLMVDSAAAELAKDRAALNTLKVQLADLDMQIKIAVDALGLVKIFKDRYEMLSKEDAVSIQQFQNYALNYDQTNLQLAKMSTDRDVTAKKIVEQESQIAQDEAKLGLARYNLSQTEIVAPFDGFVVNMYTMQGQYATAGIPFCGVVGEKCWIEANYKECYVGRIKPGQKARIQVDLYPFTIFEGEVDSILHATSIDENKTTLTTSDKVLPYIKPTIDWVRLEHRFTVTIRITRPPEGAILRMGGSARTAIDL